MKYKHEGKYIFFLNTKLKYAKFSVFFTSSTHLLVCLGFVCSILLLANVVVDCFICSFAIKFKFLLLVNNFF